MEKRLLTLKELCEYTGWGMTKVREIVRRKDCTFAVRLGNKYFVDKNRFDSFLEKSMDYHMPI